MSCRTDEERHDREFCGMEDHRSDGDWDDPADDYEPAPFTAPVSLARTVDTPCGHLTRGLSHGSRWQVCGSRLRRDGRCAGCGQVPK